MATLRAILFVTVADAMIPPTLQSADGRRHLPESDVLAQALNFGAGQAGVLDHFATLP
jgi:hypothetical protein